MKRISYIYRLSAVLLFFNIIINIIAPYKVQAAETKSCLSPTSVFIGGDSLSDKLSPDKKVKKRLISFLDFLSSSKHFTINVPLDKKSTFSLIAEAIRLESKAKSNTDLSYRFNVVKSGLKYFMAAPVLYFLKLIHLNLYMIMILSVTASLYLTTLSLMGVDLGLEGYSLDKILIENSQRSDLISSADKYKNMQSTITSASYLDLLEKNSEPSSDIKSNHYNLVYKFANDIASFSSNHATADILGLSSLQELLFKKHEKIICTGFTDDQLKKIDMLMEVMPYELLNPVFIVGSKHVSDSIGYRLYDDYKTLYIDTDKLDNDFYALVEMLIKDRVADLTIYEKVHVDKNTYEQSVLKAASLIIKNWETNQTQYLIDEATQHYVVKLNDNNWINIKGFSAGKVNFFRDFFNSRPVNQIGRLYLILPTNDTNLGGWYVEKYKTLAISKSLIYGFSMPTLFLKPNMKFFNQLLGSKVLNHEFGHHVDFILNTNNNNQFTELNDASLKDAVVDSLKIKNFVSRYAFDAVSKRDSLGNVLEKGSPRSEDFAETYGLFPALAVGEINLIGLNPHIFQKFKSVAALHIVDSAMLPQELKDTKKDYIFCEGKYTEIELFGGEISDEAFFNWWQKIVVKKIEDMRGLDVNSLMDNNLVDWDNLEKIADDLNEDIMPNSNLMLYDCNAMRAFVQKAKTHPKAFFVFCGTSAENINQIEDALNWLDKYNQGADKLFTLYGEATPSSAVFYLPISVFADWEKQDKLKKQISNLYENLQEYDTVFKSLDIYVGIDDKNRNSWTVKGHAWDVNAAGEKTMHNDRYYFKWEKSFKGENGYEDMMSFLRRWNFTKDSQSSGYQMPYELGALLGEGMRLLETGKFLSEGNLEFQPKYFKRIPSEVAEIYTKYIFTNGRIWGNDKEKQLAILSSWLIDSGNENVLPIVDKYLKEQKQAPSVWSYKLYNWWQNVRAFSLSSVLPTIVVFNVVPWEQLLNLSTTLNWALYGVSFLSLGAAIFYAGHTLLAKSVQLFSKVLKLNKAPLDNELFLQAEKFLKNSGAKTIITNDTLVWNRFAQTDTATGNVILSHWLVAKTDNRIFNYLRSYMLPIVLSHESDRLKGYGTAKTILNKLLTRPWAVKQQKNKLENKFRSEVLRSLKRLSEDKLIDAVLLENTLNSLLRKSLYKTIAKKDSLSIIRDVFRQENISFVFDDKNNIISVDSFSSDAETAIKTAA